MKDNEKKVKATEEVKEEVQTEEEGVELTDEELSSVAAGNVRPDPDGRNQPESDTRADFELGVNFLEFYFSNVEKPLNFKEFFSSFGQNIES